MMGNENGRMVGRGGFLPRILLRRTSLTPLHSPRDSPLRKNAEMVRKRRSALSKIPNDQTLACSSNFTTIALLIPPTPCLQRGGNSPYNGTMLPLRSP